MKVYDASLAHTPNLLLWLKVICWKWWRGVFWASHGTWMALMCWRSLIDTVWNLMSLCSSALMFQCQQGWRNLTVVPADWVSIQPQMELVEIAMWKKIQAITHSVVYFSFVEYDYPSYAEINSTPLLFFFFFAILQPIILINWAF